MITCYSKWTVLAARHEERQEVMYSSRVHRMVGEWTTCMRLLSWRRHRTRTSFLHSSLLLSLLCLMAHRTRTSFLHSSLLLSFLCLMAHRTRTSFLHSSLLLAFLSIVLQVYPLFFISFSMVRLHFVFGLPLFLFPSVSILGLPLSCLQMVYVEHAQAISISFESTKSPCPWCL